MPTEPAEPASSPHRPEDSLPVGDKETILRRVLKREVEYNRGKTPPLQAGAFLPTPRDGVGPNGKRGLSLNRLKSERFPAFLTPEQLKHWHETPQGIRETCGVVSVPTGKVRSLGLSVEPDPASTPGHVLIDQLNWDDFDKPPTDETRVRILGWALQLANAAFVEIAPGKPPKAQPAGS